MGSIGLTATSSGAQETTRNVLSGVNVQTAPVHVGNAEYEELTPEESVNVTAAIFFDGTANNRENTNIRLEYEKMKRGEPHNAELVRKYRDIWWGTPWSPNKTGSYDNDHSNISRIEPAYEAVDEEKVKKFSIYIEGIGTENEGSDSKTGMGLGTGSTGVRAKVKKGCEQVAIKIERTGEKDINVLTIETYGFSRGAAAARNFIHEITQRKGQFKKRVGRGGKVYWKVDHGALGEFLEEKGINVKMVVIHFTGLFDTVASLGLSHGNNTTQLKLNAVKKSQNTLQLAAADEHRSNFRLTDIRSTGNRGIEKFLPGVHSDIGGGYVDNSDEEVRLDYTVTNLNDLERERQLLIDQGWFQPNEITISDFWGTLTGDRKGLSNKYSYIPLQIMAKFSKDKGVNFVMSKITRSYAITSELSSAKTILDEYVFNDGVEMSYDNPEHRILLGTLRNRYFHFSAHYNSIGMGPNRVHGNRERVTQAG
ncbi:T6SS phospholipase effector Tle1-like catalytic domain-containing protein [Aquimarina sp. M1]